MSGDYGMECPVCWLDFDDADHTPHVLWCGHSLCRNCVIGLQTAVMKFPFLPIQLPLLIACPWCQFLTLRMTWKGILKYPCKNFFLMWIIESLKGDNVRQRPQIDSPAASSMAITTPPPPPPPPPRRTTTTTSSPTTFGSPNVILNLRSRRHLHAEQQQQRATRNFLVEVLQGRWNLAHWQLWLARVLAFFVQLTAKLPLVFLFLFIICYVLPFSTLILALYAVITVVFAVPSVLAVYFSYPSLDWLAREIVT